MLGRGPTHIRRRVVQHRGVQQGDVAARMPEDGGALRKRRYLSAANGVQVSLASTLIVGFQICTVEPYPPTYDSPTPYASERSPK